MKRIITALLIVTAMLAAMGITSFAAADNTKGRFAGTYVDIGFDSASDLKTTTAPSDSTMEVKDGVLKMSVPKKKVTTDTAYEFALNVPQTAVDMSKPFTYSYRLRMNSAANGFMQFYSNLCDNTRLGQISINGKFGVAQFGAASVNKANNPAASDAGLLNLKDGNWHTYDVLLTPASEGKFEFAVYIDNLKIYDSTDTEYSDTGVEEKFSTLGFTSNSISDFKFKLWLFHDTETESDWTVEVDYFRVGDGTLVSAVGGDNGNADTSDITVSIAIASVAVAAVFVAASKKRSK